MCQSGNQRIFIECKVLILKELGKERAPNREMRAVLLANGGCMNGRVDTTPKVMLEVSSGIPAAVYTRPMGS